MDKVKIAILCPGYGVIMRGVETFIEELTGRLRILQPGWKFDIYTRAKSRDIEPNVRLIHVPSIDRNSRLATFYAQVGHRLGFFLRTRIDAECLSFTISLSGTLIKSRYDLILNQAGPFAGNLLRLKRRMDGTPFIHKTASGYGPIEYIMANQKPDTVVATAPYIEDWIKERIADVTVEGIPEAVDCDIFHPLDRKDEAGAPDNSEIWQSGRQIVLFVGAMDHMKRPHLLIEAMEKLPDAGLIMIGDGIIADEIKKAGNEKLGADRFLHIPKVSRETIPAYFNACDLFTLPSEEPFGIVFLEAMACNKPVLANRSPVQDWIFDDAGATCDCTNAAEYSAAIRRLLSTDYGDKPLIRSKAFSWDRIAIKYEKLFMRTAAARGR